MISYSQNREDVLLNRLFPPGYKGFYVDVGANHPIQGSVTAHFYTAREWRGVNIEPTDVYNDIVSVRTRDTNLNCAVSSQSGESTFYEFPASTGVSTFSADLAKTAEEKLKIAPRTHSVPVKTLEQICGEHASGQIDFMSIDVEGHERQVIAGGNWRKYRPRVVLVEATLPHTSIPCHQEWEPLLLSADYLFATFDGLNRYYVRAEDRDLIPLLAVPVNVFDDFVPAAEYRANSEAHSLKVRLDTMENMGPLTLAISRRLSRLETRFPSVSRTLHRLFARRPREVVELEPRS
ncbi:MAG: FkbM family methyltransferase [Planctomycetota bacterium]|nr:FkbM family methyltransferase [Planctomycetota bacterium]